MEETKKKKKKKSKKRTGPLKLDWNECPLFMPRTYDQTVDFVGTKTNIKSSRLNSHTSSAH